MPQRLQHTSRPIRNLILILLVVAAPAVAPALDLGVASIDVTPSEPIRLTGYGNRTTNSIGVEQKLSAKALAIGGDAEGPALLLTLDNCGIAEQTYRELVRRFAPLGVKQDRLIIACSHTHTGPCTAQWAPNIFSRDISPEQQAVIGRYTQELIAKLEQVARAALKDRQPGRLSWSQGSVDFARNRRVVVGNTPQFGENAAAPVDHSLPVLKVETLDGKLRALVANYACHCTTLGGEFNKLCGDWAGFAQEYLERDHPGAIAMITIGCGADANPSPRGGTDGGLALCKKHGEELAAEVNRLLALNFMPLTGKLSTGMKEIQLPFGQQFTRAQWEERAKRVGIVGYHAQKNLARLDRGEALQTQLYYPIVGWSFGDQLAFIFLPGEVVVDYSLRLKKEFDASRLWVTAYANYVPCYIPSRRILAEGGYEAEDSLWYYDRPTRISTNAEELIIKTVHELVPKQFLFDQKKAEFPDPKTPEQALATIRTKADFVVELVASEPLIESPVAIDWDARGRLWVCEMYDYPTGINPPRDVGRGYGENPRSPPGGFTPGGRIKVLTDTDGDGHYDKSTLFLDGLAFPTGVMPWRKGALICAAPDILYAEDTDGDGRADLVQTNFTGFATHNFQARVNGFTWGLDGWLHGSSGLFGGKVKSLLTGKEVDLGGRDFRIQPDTGEIEPLAGVSQMGRIRDDFDNWFGNDNSTLLWHYPLPDHYLRRNPYVTYPDPRVNVAAGDADPNKLFPISRTLERFNDPQTANRVTSACGPCIYRDDLLGSNYYGNAFICEPVHNLVTRRVLEPRGVTFSARRADDEQRSEFLASTDNWFRPVQARTGPDGALWIVDMYRFVVEHPRWIPTNRLAQLNVRAGADLGRIYRVYSKGAKLRPLHNLTKLDDAALVETMNTRNGPARDLAQCELLERRAGETPVLLRGLTTNNPSAAVRAQALATLSLLTTVPPEVLNLSLADSNFDIRRLAIRAVESPADVGDSPTFATLPASDPVASVKFQLALTLGQWRSSGTGAALAKLAQTDDRWMRAAVLSSALPHLVGLLNGVLGWPDSTPGRSQFSAQLCALAATSGTKTNIQRALDAIAPAQTADTRWYEPLTALLDAMERHSIQLNSSLTDPSSMRRIREAIAAARISAADAKSDEELRARSIGLLLREDAHVTDDLALLCNLMLPPSSPRVQTAALGRLRGQRQPESAAQLIARWTHYSPALRPSVANLLLQRDDWTRELLDATRKGTVAPNEIPPSEQQKLLKHKSDEIRRLASTLFRRARSRPDALANYSGAASLDGTADRGAAVFEKTCAQCHAYRGRGHAVGPNLAEFAGKSTQDFLVAILDPNAAINPNFLAYEIETKDGRSLSGIVKGETASNLSLIQGGGVEEKILRGDITAIRASRLSLMPEGLEQGLSPQDLADLIAWIKKSAPATFGSATPEQAARARADFLRIGANGLAKVVKSTDRLPYPGWMGRLPMPYCRQDGGQLAWTTAPIERPAIAPGGGVSSVSFRLPAAMGFVSQPSGKFTLKLNDQPVLDFDVTLTDQVWQSTDGHVRMTYTVLENNSEDSNGVLVIELAADLFQAGERAKFEVAGSPSNSQRWFGIYLTDN